MKPKTKKKRPTGFAAAHGSTAVPQTYSVRWEFKDGGNVTNITNMDDALVTAKRWLCYGADNVKITTVVKLPSNSELKNAGH